MAPAVHFRSAVCAARPVPRPRRRRPRRRRRARSCCVQGPTARARPRLLRACAGLVPVTDGEAEVLGHDLRRDRRAVRRRIGLLGHATFLYDDLTVADNLAFAARAAGGRRRPTADAPWPASASTGRLRDVPVARLSAGQRRRVALAAVLARGARAVAARRAPRRPRRRRPRPARRPGPGGGRRRAPPCCWPPTSWTGPPPWPTGSHRRRRPRHRRRPLPAAPTRSRPMWRDAMLVAGQGPADRGPLAGGHQPGRCPSPSWCSCCSPSPSTPTAACWPGGGRAVLGGGAVLAPCWPSSALRHRGRRRAPATPCACRASTAPASSWARRCAVAVQLVVLEVVLAVGRRRALRRRAARAPACCSPPACWRPSGWPPPARSTASLAAGLRVRETLLPLLLLPVAGARAAGRHPGVGGGPAGTARPTAGRGCGSWPSSPSSTWPSASSPSAPCWRKRDQPPSGQRRHPRRRHRAGSVTLALIGLAAWLALVGLSPPDVEQKDAVRLICHPRRPRRGCAMYLSFGVTTLASALYLWKRTRAPLLGPPGRRLGRDRRGLHRPHPGHRLHLGPAHLGRVVDLGRPPDHDRRAVRALPRLPGRAPGAGRRPRCGPGGPPSSALAAFVDVPIVHYVGGVVAHAAPAPPARSTRAAWATPIGGSMLGAAARRPRLHPALRLAARPPLPPGGASRSELEAEGLDRRPSPSARPRPTSEADVPVGRVPAVTPVGYVFAGYGITLGVLAAYAARVLARAAACPAVARRHAVSDAAARSGPAVERSQAGDGPRPGCGSR